MVCELSFIVLSGAIVLNVVHEMSEAVTTREITNGIRVITFYPI